VTGYIEVSTLKERVLILDDEQMMLNVLERYVGALDHECFCCECPTKALSALTPGSFALLITDLRMPGMDGIEVLRLAKSQDEDVAVIVVTAVADVSNAIQAIRAGADDYILKPFSYADLALAVSKALEKRSRLMRTRKLNQDLEKQVSRATEQLERANRELTETKHYLESLLHSSVDAIITADRSGKIQFCNEGACVMLGIAAEQMHNLPVANFFAGGRHEVNTLRRRLSQEGCLRCYETEFIRADGSHVPVNMSLSMVSGSDGGASAILAICKDITQQKRLETELKEMSIKDSLTGLYNQRYFYERLRGEIERARRQKHPLSLLWLDIDQFKSYNDTRGHLEGDLVLQTVGKVFQECTRTSVDLGFRYGGDEFTVILPEAGEEQAHLIANRILRGFEAHHFDRLTMSIGLMSYREGDSLRAFIHMADAMMYDAKRSGGNSVFVYSPEAEAKEESDAR
jgi:diguanylate cyclase (GGDEF)-like protein/PAS domain S-box-containing protein